MYRYPAPQTKLNSGQVRLRNNVEVLVLGPYLCTRICRHHDWPVENVMVDLAIKMKGNSKRSYCNSLSPLGGPGQGSRRCFADLNNQG